MLIHNQQNVSLHKLTKFNLIKMLNYELMIAILLVLANTSQNMVFSFYLLLQVLDFLNSS